MSAEKKTGLFPRLTDERGSHAALRRSRVGPRRVELRDHRGPRVRSGLDRGAHPGTARSHDDDVELVVVHAVHDRAVLMLRH